MKIPKESISRFWQQVDKRGPDECWPWIGPKEGDGRGHLTVQGKHYRAHRFSWMLHYGEIPHLESADSRGTCVCHECDNPNCVNPNHLFLGSNMDNRQDSVNKGRHGKLTIEEVKEIRQRYSNREPSYYGYPTQRDLAEEYNVSRGNISYIVTNKTFVET